MEFDRVKVRQVVEEDRLSSLQDELIHKILSDFDMKFVVQTSVLSSRWKFLWTSMPCLKFSSDSFRTLSNFAKFVTHVLSHRNHQAEVSSVKLNFDGAADEDFVSKIASYAFSHNVQKLTVINKPLCRLQNYPPCLFSSQSLKHFILIVEEVSSDCITLDTPLDFPSLTTMHIEGVTLCGDLFSKCVNLKKLTLEDFFVDVEVFDIIAPRLSNLSLIRGGYINDINLIAPQLEDLTIIDCEISYLNAPPGLLSLWCSGYSPMQLSKDGFYSLNKATICLYMSWVYYKEEDARKIIKMLQELHSAKYLTLNWDIIECLSSFPDLLSHQPSPFTNLLCLSIDYSILKKDTCDVKMSSQVKKFLLGNSPSAKFIQELP